MPRGSQAGRMGSALRTQRAVCPRDVPGGSQAGRMGSGMRTLEAPGPRDVSGGSQAKGWSQSEMGTGGAPR